MLTKNKAGRSSRRSRRTGTGQSQDRLQADQTSYTGPMISLKAINKSFKNGENELHVLKDISLDIEKGEFVTIMGPSGSGKSTLINVIGFLDNDFSGEYYFEGRPVHQRSDNEISHLRNQMVGFVFQDFNLIDNLTVEENVRLPLLYRGLFRRQTQSRVEEALDMVGILDKAKNLPSTLSGGQRQRVAIARALANHPHFIIADEPTGALDTKTGRAVMEIFSQLNQEEGVTIIMVTHDPSNQVFASRHIDIVDGWIRDRGSDMTPTFADEELLAKIQAQEEAAREKPEDSQPAKGSKEPALAESRGADSVQRLEKGGRADESD